MVVDSPNLTVIFQLNLSIRHRPSFWCPTECALRSQLNNCMFMNMGSSSWGRILIESLCNKVTSGAGFVLGFLEDSTMCITCRTYLLWENLDFPSLINPLAMVLSVRNIDWSSPYFSGSMCCRGITISLFLLLQLSRRI